MAVFKPSEMIMKIDYCDVVEDGDVMYACCEAKPVAELVRCKDCKWWDKVDNIDGVNYGTCERKCTAIRQDIFPNENWFCADGERRTDDLQ